LEQARSESCLEQLISFRDGDLEKRKTRNPLSSRIFLLPGTIPA